ncbi:MAG: hypothetical protein ACXVRK_01960 [Gaiellaceae bacterium]
MAQWRMRIGLRPTLRTSTSGVTHIRVMRIDSAATGACNDDHFIVTRLIDLAVTKVCWRSLASQKLGAGNSTWTIVVANRGPDRATGVTVADPMPARKTFVSTTATQVVHGRCDFALRSRNDSGWRLGDHHPRDDAQRGRAPGNETTPRRRPWSSTSSRRRRRCSVWRSARRRGNLVVG